MTSPSNYEAIHDYGIIGDMNSCALVSRSGAIDWACFPRFDSPSHFAAILDAEKGGRFAIEPVGTYTSTQRYVGDTNVLETVFTTGNGSVCLTDFMPTHRGDADQSPHEIHRLLRGLTGTVKMRITFQPRLDYGRGETELTLAPRGALARHGDETLALVSPVPLALKTASDGGRLALAEEAVSSGDRLSFAAAYGLTRVPSSAGAMDTEEKLQRTVRFWEAHVAKINYQGRWRNEVIRSFLLLHLLTYEPSGAIVAAPTTSLPEHIGGGRNWDYRYCWLRDAAWTVGILYRLGDPHEGEAFTGWLVSQCWIGLDEMQILYGICPESELTERGLDHLSGYRGSAPVRIGNDAAFHRQTDVFGEVALSLATYHRYHGTLPKGGWELIERLATLAAHAWKLPDRGIWEVRGPEQHFVYSKIMCWVALDRAIHLAEAHGYTGPVEFWRYEAEMVRAEVLDRGWSEAKQSFVQAYDSENIDASALFIPFAGILPPDDPRVRSTIRRVQEELGHGPFIKRYRHAETDDGLGSDEGAFYILSFWLIGALLSIGERDEAMAIFEEVLDTANHLGLFAEMIDPTSRQALGNFPQAFSHIGFIHTARNLSMAFGANDHEELLG